MQPDKEQTLINENAKQAASSIEVKRTTQPTEPEKPLMPTVNVPAEPQLDDSQTDAAIDDITINDSDELLAVQDASLQNDQPPTDQPPKQGFSFKRLLRSKWFYICLAIIIIIFALPYSRYRILGLVFKHGYQFSVIDSVTKTPVSDATIDIDHNILLTNGNGQVRVKVALGEQTYVVKKRYYKSYSGQVFVGITSPKPAPIYLSATGRRVPIEILNKINDQPVVNAEINVSNTDAKTNSKGLAYIVLPTTATSYKATVKTTGYNTLTTKVVVSTNVNANSFKLVPAGSVYFLNNSTGTINVIKANLDGSDPQVILTGSGNEKTNTTFLMASPDWKYLVLEAQRTAQPELYVINTSNNQLTEFDSAADSFNLIGWNGDQFIYNEVASPDQTSTAGAQQIKSYNALNAQLNVLDQNQVSGSGNSYAYQNFYNFNLLPSQLIYNTNWNSVGGYDLSSLSDTIRGVEPNGYNKKDYQSFTASTISQIKTVRNLPQSLYFGVVNSNGQTSYYNYANGAVNSGGASASSLNQTYPTYYFSPSNDQTLWSQTANGQTLTYIGDQNGQNQKLVSLPSGYSAYGWYDSSYILLTKANQLYIAPVGGTKQPTLIGSYLY